MSKCSVLVVACMDYRIQGKIKAYLKSLGHLGREEESYDGISGAGGPQMLVHPERRSWVLEQIGIGVEMHGVNKVILLAHRDCAMYGGSRSFSGCSAEETAYKDDLEKAAGHVCGLFPGIIVSKHIMDI